jgi:hypothetical protein
MFTTFLMLAMQAVEPTPAPSIPKPPLVCREDDQMVGSHIHSGRRCKTAEEWREEDTRRSQVPTTLRVMPTDGSAQQPAQRPQI